MFDKQEFITSAFNLSQIPSADLPSVVLCGRSNVGKSSFINSIFNRKDLAKTSSTPGKTRSINYYLIDNKFYMVDLPGYGYAKTSKKEREHWSMLIDAYLQKAHNNSLAMHFIDSRHDPMELDIKLNFLLREFEIPYIALLNKIDKLKQSELARAKRNIVQFFPELSAGDNLLFYSSVKGTGKKEVLQRLARLFYAF